MQTLLVYNASSGFFIDRLEDISVDDYFRGLFAESSAENIQLRRFDGDELQDLHADWREHRPAAVWVAGGDGTILAIAAITAELDIPLGILPAGTVNLLARDLGIELDMAAAIAQLSGAETACLDMAERKVHCCRLVSTSTGAYWESISLAMPLSGLCHV